MRTRITQSLIFGKPASFSRAKKIRLPHNREIPLRVDDDGPVFRVFVHDDFRISGYEQGGREGITEERFRPADCDTLFPGSRVSCVGIEDVVVTDSVSYEKTLVITCCGGSQLCDGQDSEITFGAGMLNADIPILIVRIFAPAVKVAARIDESP